MNATRSKLTLLLVVLLMVMLPVLAGCQAAATPAPTQEEPAAQAPATLAPAETKPLRMVFVTPLLAHSAWLQAKEGAEAAAKDMGFTVEWVGPQNVDIEAQIQYMEQAIASGADGIISCPLNTEAFLGVYDKAKEAGVPIVNTLVDSPEDTRLAYIGTSNETYGTQAAERMVEKMGGKANIAVFETSLDSTNQNLTLDAFKKGIANYPDMKIVAVEADSSEMTAAIEKITQVLATYPEIDAVLCLEGICGPALAQILKEQNRTDIAVMAVDDLPETVQGIRDGWIWSTMAQRFYVVGYEAAKMIQDAANGKTVPSITDSGIVYIDKNNVDTYSLK